MVQYTLRRLYLGVVTAFLVSLLVFGIMPSPLIIFAEKAVAVLMP